MIFSALVKSNQLAVEKLSNGIPMSFLDWAKVHRFSGFLDKNQWTAVSMISNDMPEEQAEFLFKKRKLCKIKVMYKEYLYYSNRGNND